jgi:hypothetical protein
MDVDIEYHWTQSQRGAPALQIGTNLYRIQKKNKNGTIRLTCTDERCNASVTMYEDKIKYMRGIHRHQERILPYHIGEMVHEFRQVATKDLRTPLPQIYDHLTKQFVCFSFYLNI